MAPILISRYHAGWNEMRELAPQVPLYRFLLRLAVWNACKIAKARPVVRLHSRSRMRLAATRQSPGIETAIFLFRDAYEPSVADCIDRFVRPGTLCYDIGANIGLWSLRMGERTGTAGRVFAFEPLSTSARALAANAALSGLANIEVMPFALGDTDGHATLHVPADAGRSALAPESPADATERVRVRRLDDVWEEQRRPAVSFVKMDVEGAEPMVLRGAQAFFTTVRPVTCCEINPGKLRNMGFAARDVLDAFASWDYRALSWSHSERRLIAYRPPEDLQRTQDLVFLPDQAK